MKQLIDKQLKNENGKWLIYNQMKEEWGLLEMSTDSYGYAWKEKEGDFIKINIENGKPAFKPKTVKAMQCYNCGISLDSSNKTAEHIPAQSLFEGTTHLNRITVPACSTCNNKYASTDEEFRNMIGVISKDYKNLEITKKSISGITKRLNTYKHRLYFNNFGNFEAMQFSLNEIEKFHIKNFKGLFHHEYGIPISDEYIFNVNVNEKDYSKNLLLMLAYLTNNFEWKNSGNEKVFKYIIQPFKEIRKKRLDKSDIKPVAGEPYFLGVMCYNDTHCALVVGALKSALEKNNKKRENSNRQKSNRQKSNFKKNKKSNFKKYKKRYKSKKK